MDSSTTRNGRDAGMEGTGSTLVPSGAGTGRSDALTTAERAIVERMRRERKITLQPPGILLPIVDRLAARVAELERTADQLRASNRRLADRRRSQS